jgi:hypothetical protein
VPSDREKREPGFNAARSAVVKALLSEFPSLPENHYDWELEKAATVILSAAATARPDQEEAIRKLTFERDQAEAAFKAHHRALGQVQQAKTLDEAKGVADAAIDGDWERASLGEGEGGR